MVTYFSYTAQVAVRSAGHSAQTSIPRPVDPVAHFFYEVLFNTSDTEMQRNCFFMLSKIPGVTFFLVNLVNTRQQYWHLR